LFYFIYTTGGTGIGPRDVTPEATKQVIDYEIPGIPEMMRVKNYSKSSYVALSRALAGVSHNKLVINLPGSPKAVQENLEIIYPLIKHALELINGNTNHESNKR
jgi:molybdenum cofactor synthesis domain-containing protein